MDLRIYITDSIVKLFIYTVFISTLFAVNLYDVSAQGIGASVSPAIIEDRINPGDVYSDSIRITNNEPAERTFFIFSNDIKGLSDDGLPIFSEGGEPTGYELSEWIQVQASVTVPSGQTRTVPFTISVPQNASPGGHFGGIFFSAEAERLRLVGAGIGYQVGTIINLRIAGDVREEADMREFTTDKSIYSNPTVIFSAEIQNLGNVLLRPRGPLDVINMFGKTVASIRVNDTGAALLPESRRSFVATWEGEGLHFGRYEAIVALLYGEDGRKTTSASVSFWILPLRILFPLIGGTFLFILLGYGTIRFLVHRKVRELHRLSTEASRGQLRMKGRKQPAVPQQRAPFSKISIVAIVLLAFTLIFLTILFVLFA